MALATPWATVPVQGCHAHQGCHLAPTEMSQLRPFGDQHRGRCRSDARHAAGARLRARACGYEAKTDALDARVLARDGQVFPASDPCPSENKDEREELQQLLRRRRQRVAQRVQERNRLDNSVSPVVGPPGGT